MKDFMEIGETTTWTEDTPNGTCFYGLKRITGDDAKKILGNLGEVIIDLSYRDIQQGPRKGLVLNSTYLYTIHEIYFQDEPFNFDTAFSKAVYRYLLSQESNSYPSIAFYVKY